MEKTLAIKYLSHHRVRKVLADNPTAVGSTQVLTDAKTTFDTKLTALDAINVPEVNNTMPNTAYKNKKMAEVSNQLLVACDGLSLYAASISDVVLAGKMVSNISELREGNEVTQLQRFWSILNAAKAITPADIIPFGVTAADLTSIETLLLSLNDLIGSPRSAIDARVLLNDQQAAAFAEMDEFLTTTLDLAVRNRKLAFPDFVAAYTLARKQHNMPSQSVEEELEALKSKVAEARVTTSELNEALEPLTIAQPTMNGVH